MARRAVRPKHLLRSAVAIRPVAPWCGELARSWRRLAIPWHRTTGNNQSTGRSSSGIPSSITSERRDDLAALFHSGYGPQDHPIISVWRMVSLGDNIQVAGGLG